MPSSAVHTFTDPGDYAAAIRATTIDLTVMERGHFIGKRVRIDLHRLWMQRLSESLPRTLHSAFVTERAIVTFRTQPGPRLLWSGVELQPSNIIRHNEGENAFQHSSGPVSWGAMSLPVEDIVSVGAAIAGLDLMPPKDPLILTPLPSAIAKLQRLHAAAGNLAENAPEIIANPDAAYGLEQALIEALVGCLHSREGRENSSAQGQHAIVMRRFRRVVEENPEQPLYISGVCKAIRVSERTLRMCCQEHLRMGPKRYLLLRRMHLAQQALRRAAPDATSVTDIATRFGFWQLGRFAVEYQSLFGEAPSATLRQLPVTEGIRLPKLHSRPRGRAPKVEVLRSPHRR
jgi:methylphosphotriester-DNA--protein-cysteine methyltransferase